VGVDVLDLLLILLDYQVHSRSALTIFVHRKGRLRLDDVSLHRGKSECRVSKSSPKAMKYGFDTAWAFPASLDQMESPQATLEKTIPRW
jgi:hypothetical protein